MILHPHTSAVCLVALLAISAPASLGADEVDGASRPAVGAAVTLVSEARTIAPGQPFTVALHVRHGEGYHTYWRNPGVIGLPTSIAWDLPEGFAASPIRWQQPELSKMAVYTVWGYESDALLLVDITPPASLSPGTRVTLRGKASWMACAKACHPTSGEVSLTLPVEAKPRVNDAWRARFDKVRAGLPRELPQWSVTARRTDDGFTLTLTPRDAGAVNRDPRDVYYFGHRRMVSSNHPQRFARVGDRYVLHLARERNTPDDADRLTGHVYCPTGWLADGSATAMVIDTPLDDRR